MTKTLLILFAILGAFVTDIRAESPIDFSTNDNLKAVYDAGFRPWRSTMSSCTVTDKNISVILPENVQFSLPTQIATFSVLAEDQLSSANFIGEVMLTDQAVAKVHEICTALSLPTEGLDEAIPTFAGRASKPTIWNTRGKTGTISIDVTMDRLDFIDHLGAKVYVGLHWQRNDASKKFWTSPMQPPSGYEHESMTPPGVNPNQKGFPAHDMQYYKNLIAKKKAEEGNAPTSPTPTPTASQSSPVRETGIPWWVYAIIVLSLGTIAGLWYFLRLKK